MIFGVEYVNQDDINHLIALIRMTYKLTKNWTGNLYCSICLNWDYTNCTVVIPCQGTLKRNCSNTFTLQANKSRVAHTHLPQSNLVPRPRLHSPQTPHLNWIKQVSKSAKDSWQHFVLCTSHQHDCPHDSQHHHAKQTIATTARTLEQCTQMLDYLAHNADAKVRFHASDMIMNIHLDASYLSKAKARSQTCGHFFMGWMPKNSNPIKINGAIHVSANILRFMVASTAEAELGDLYHNCQTGIIFSQMLEAVGHKQTKTPVHCDNATAVGIANNTLKQQRLR
jgi:hypothetical protein